MSYNFNLDFSNVLGSGAFDFSGMSFGEPVVEPEPTKQAPKVITRPDPLDVVSERSDPIEDAINNLADKGSIDLGLDFSVAPIDLTGMPTQATSNVETSAAPPTVAPSNATPAQSGVEGVNTGGAMSSTSPTVDLTASPSAGSNVQSTAVASGGRTRGVGTSGVRGEGDGNVTRGTIDTSGIDIDNLADPLADKVQNIRDEQDYDANVILSDFDYFLPEDARQYSYDLLSRNALGQGVADFYNELYNSEAFNADVERAIQQVRDAGISEDVTSDEEIKRKVMAASGLTYNGYGSEATGTITFSDGKYTYREPWQNNNIKNAAFTIGSIAVTGGMASALSGSAALAGLSSTTANAFGGALASGAMAGIKGGNLSDIAKAVVLGGLGGALKGAAIDNEAAELAAAEAFETYGSYSDEFAAAYAMATNSSTALDVLSDADKLIAFGTAIDEGKDPLKALASVYGEDIANYALPHLADMAGEFVGENYGTDVVTWLRDNEKLVDTGVRLAGGERPLAVITDIYGEDALDYLEVDSNAGRATGFGLMATAVALDEGEPPEFALLAGLKEFYDRDGLDGVGTWAREQLRAFDDNVIQKFLDLIPSFDFGDSKGLDINWDEFLPDFEGFDLSGFDGPDIDLSFEGPDLDFDFEGPDLDVEFTPPDFDLDIPQFDVDLNGPDVDVEGPDLSGIEGPDVSTDGMGLDVDAGIDKRYMDYYYDDSDLVSNPFISREQARIRSLTDALALEQAQAQEAFRARTLEDEDKRKLRTKPVYTAYADVNIT